MIIKKYFFKNRRFSGEVSPKSRAVFGALLCSIAVFCANKSLLASPEARKEASAQITQARYAKAAAILEQDVKQDPKDRAAWNLLGYSYMMQGRYQRAHSAYRKSDALGSTLYSQSGLQWSLLALGRYDESLEFGERILRKNPNNYFAQIRSAAAYLGKHNYQKAARLYDHILRRYPRSADAYYGAGLSYEALGQKTKAERYFQQGLKLAPYHAGLRIKAGLASSHARFYLTPFASITSFENSSNKTSTNNYGLGFAWTLNPSWALNGSIQQSVTERPKGFRVYTTSSPQAAAPGPGGPPGAGLGLSIGTQIFENTGGRYVNDVGQLGLRWIYHPKLSVYASGFALQSNDPFGDDAGAGYVSLFWGTPALSLELGAGYLGFQRHIGRQGTLGLHYQIWKNLYGSSVLYGQRINYRRYSVNNSYNTELGTVYDPSFSDYEAWSKNYAAAEQRLTLYWASWKLGLGYRGGELYTPVLASGTSIVYNTDRLDEGYSASIGYSLTPNIGANLLYSVDRWTASTGETPTSRQALLSVTFSF